MFSSAQRQIEDDYQTHFRPQDLVYEVNFVYRAFTEVRVQQSILTQISIYCQEEATVSDVVDMHQFHPKETQGMGEMVMGMIGRKMYNIKFSTT